jgi:hypothetical protein
MRFFLSFVAGANLLSNCDPSSQRLWRSRGIVRQEKYRRVFFRRSIQAALRGGIIERRGIGRNRNFRRSELSAATRRCICRRRAAVKFNSSAAILRPQVGEITGRDAPVASQRHESARTVFDRRLSILKSPRSTFRGGGASRAAASALYAVTFGEIRGLWYPSPHTHAYLHS